MTWLRRVRPVLYLLGVLLVVGSLLGARLLTHGSGGGTEPAPKTAAPTNGKNGSGPVVTGHVDSESPLVGYGLPPVIQSGTIAEVFVKQFHDVKKGDPLYAFDSSVQAGDVKRAAAAVAIAQREVESAEVAVRQHQVQLDLQREAIKNAAEKVKQAKQSLEVTRHNLREFFKQGAGTNTTEAQIEEKVANHADFLRADLAHQTAIREHGFETEKLEGLKKTGPEHLVAKAKAGLEQALAAETQAKTVLELCTVRARSDGTVERVNFGPGQVVGVSTRESVVVLIPAGPLVVRAEVEAEFAHRIGPDKIGKEVVISDHYDGKITYKGVVRNRGSAFLQKRTAADGFGVNDTRVLEVLVEVTDPSPPGKPALAVGQKVRVNFGP